MGIQNFTQYEKLARYTHDILNSNSDSIKPYAEQLVVGGKNYYMRCVNTANEFEDALPNLLEEDREIAAHYVGISKDYNSNIHDLSAQLTLNRMMLDLNSRTIGGDKIRLSQQLSEEIKQKNAELESNIDTLMKRNHLCMSALDSITNGNHYDPKAYQMPSFYPEDNEYDTAHLTGTDDEIAANESALEKAFADRTDNKIFPKLDKNFSKFKGDRIPVAATMHINTKESEGMSIEDIMAVDIYEPSGKALEWAAATVDNMFRTVYDKRTYDYVFMAEDDKNKLLDTLYVDGISCADKYPNKLTANRKDMYEYRCLKLMKDLASSENGARLDIRLMEPDLNGEYHPSEDNKLCRVNVTTTPEAKHSIWRKIINFIKELVGINTETKTEQFREKMSFSDLSDEAVTRNISIKQKSENALAISAARSAASINWSSIGKRSMNDPETNRSFAAPLYNKNLTTCYISDGIDEPVTSDTLIGNQSAMKTHYAFSYAMAAAKDPHMGMQEFSAITLDDLTATHLSGATASLDIPIAEAARTFTAALMAPSLSEILGEEIADNMAEEKLRDPDIREKYMNELQKSKYRAESMLYDVSEGLKKLGKELRELDLNSSDPEEVQEATMKYTMFNTIATNIKEAIDGGIVSKDEFFDESRRVLNETIDRFYDKDIERFLDIMSDKEMTSPVIADPDAFCEKLAFCIAQRYGLASSFDCDANERDHKLIADRAASLKTQLTEMFNTNRDAIEQARDIATGAAERPDGLFPSKKMGGDGITCDIQKIIEESKNNKPSFTFTTPQPQRTK